jgi:phosphate transport system substrate-binding protein
MHLVRRVVLWLVILTCSTTITGCATQPRYNQQGGPEGTISISGAWALYPMMVRWAEEYQLAYPGIRFDISAGGAGKGMADALGNAVDIGMVSRSIYPEEIKKGAFAVAVAKDAVMLTVNQDNPVLADLQRRGVTQETLVGIYITGEVTTWGQVVDRSEVTEPIHVFTRSDAAGAPATWAEYLGGQQEDLLGVGVYGDPGLLDAVIKDRLAIGFNNLNYAYDLESGRPVTGATVITLDANSNQRVDPDEQCTTKNQAVESVSLGHYPSPPARPLYLVTRGKPTGLVQGFIQWILEEGQQYLDEAGYIALPRDTISRELERIR